MYNVLFVTVNFFQPTKLFCLHSPSVSYIICKS